ncbi:hypothetical protein LINPERHAP2_LOCUS39625 [Linum perenne]
MIQKRSSSSCVQIKRRKGDRFWKIGRFFTTKRSSSKIKGTSEISHSVAAIEDQNGDVWILDDCPTTLGGGGYGGGMVLMSRSLCSFRGWHLFRGSELRFRSQDLHFRGSELRVQGAGFRPG